MAGVGVGVAVSALLCAAPHCRLPSRHSTDCDSDQCRGCLPAIAADGLMLCRLHTDRLAPDAIESARLHGELTLCLIGSGGMDEVRASNPQPGLSLRDKVIEQRTEIRHTLVSWALLIAEERGVGLPEDTVTAVGKFVAAHGQWLAAQPFAADASDELATLVHKARALRQPSGTRVVEIGPCPQPGEEGDCPGTLRALLRREASLLPSAVTCDANEEHSWDSTQWTKLGRTMAKVRAA